jgi:hypothetical protein
MKITIEFNTLNVDFEDNRIDAVVRIMEQAKEKVIDCMLKPILSGPGAINVPIKDINGNRIGVLEINL